MGQAFQPEQLDRIDKAFDQAWAQLSTHRRMDPEVLKALLRDKLLALVAAGVNDVELIRKMAVGAITSYEKNHKAVLNTGNARPLNSQPVE